MGKSYELALCSLWDERRHGGDVWRHNQRVCIYTCTLQVVVTRLPFMSREPELTGRSTEAQRSGQVRILEVSGPCWQGSVFQRSWSGVTLDINWLETPAIDELIPMPGSRQIHGKNTMMKSINLSLIHI